MPAQIATAEDLAALHSELRADLHQQALDAAREEGRKAGLEEALKVIADLEDDYGEFAAIVALDRSSENIRALIDKPADAQKEGE